MALALMLIAGVATGLSFDVMVLAAQCFVILMVGSSCAAWTGVWHSTMTLATGILVLQVGYAVGMLVYEWRFSSRARAGRRDKDPNRSA